MGLGASLFGDASSSDVKPKPMKLMTNARTDMPANLNFFLEERLWMTLINPIVKNIGMQTRLASASSKKTVSIVISPFICFLPNLSV